MANRDVVAAHQEAQAVFSQILLERLRQDTHPSRAHMEILEQTLPPSLYGEYFDVLLEKVASDPQPSIPMLRHIAQLVGRA